MSERKINLEEIAKLEFPEKESGYSFETLNAVTKNLIIRAMKEACRQTLELAAENAKTKQDPDFYCLQNVDKKSITNTINQIE